MSTAQASSISPARRWTWWQLLFAAAGGAVLFYLIAVVFPKFSLLYGYSGIKQLLLERTSLGENWSSVFALAGSFLYAILWVPMLWATVRLVVWRFNARNVALAFIGWMIVYGHAPLLRALMPSDICFNQRTGEPLQWFVIRPGGEVVLSDSPGFDQSTRIERQPVTPQICRIAALQKKGIGPRRITDDPRIVTYFDTGRVRVWYYKAADGQIELFDAEGTHPGTGALLLPVTAEVADEARKLAEAREAAAKRAAELKAAEDAARKTAAEREAGLASERKLAEAKKAALKELVALFGVDSYPDGVMLIGSMPRQQDEASREATRQLLSLLASNLRQKGLVVDEFRPQVYAAGHFERMLNGNVAVLSDVGLRQKMRAAILTAVSAACRPASAASEVTSCTVSVEARFVRSEGHTSTRQISMTGAGGSTTQAVTRATELLVERHPEIFEGI